MKLIICNTYSQLIIAIQMKLTIFKEANVDLWVSDHSKNVDKILGPLVEQSIFASVEYIREKEFVYNRGKFKCLLDSMEYSFGGKKLKIKKYDEIIFYSLSLRLYSIADYYSSISHDVIWSRMEEGLFSYETDFVSGKRIKLTRKLRKFSGRAEIANNIKNYYCFFPALKENNRGWNLIKIPSLRDTYDEITTIFKNIFNINENDLEFRTKYIYFASSSDIDGNSYGETELVIKIAESVGKDKIIVKMHPRDDRTVYQDYGINVMESSWIPWEVIQLIGKFEKIVFLTVDSGAFITISALMSRCGKGIFLYPEIQNSNREFVNRKAEIKKVLTKLHSIGLCCDINEFEHPEFLDMKYNV